MEDKKIRVNFFQRKPRKGFSFSLEYIFADLKSRLSDKIEAITYISSAYNEGFYSKFTNILEAARREGPGINHITGETHFLNLLMKKKCVILTIHDCGMVHRKAGFAKKVITWLYLSAPVRKAKMVTAVSEVTKSQIIEFAGCDPNKIVVIPVAVNPQYQPAPKIFNSSTPVILQIGTSYNKNLERLIVALNGLECHLKIIGRLSDNQISLLQENKIAYSNAYDLSNEELLQQYVSCDILSFVSTFEGFGMPIVEANSVERAVVTSSISSMPEVAADAACLVNPFDVDEIRNGFIKVINDDVFREGIIQRGRINKMRFNPDFIANQYHKLYCDLSAYNLVE